jgi:hypothetical protein
VLRNFIIPPFTFKADQNCNGLAGMRESSTFSEGKFYLGWNHPFLLSDSFSGWIQEQYVETYRCKLCSANQHKSTLSLCLSEILRALYCIRGYRGKAPAAWGKGGMSCFLIWKKHVCRQWVILMPHSGRRLIPGPCRDGSIIETCGHCLCDESSTTADAVLYVATKLRAFQSTLHSNM